MLPQGSITALVTPFYNNKISFSCFENLLKYQLDNGIDGLLVAGTTGEAATLSSQEYQDLLKTAVNYVDKKVPIFAGTGSNSTSQTIATTEIAAKLGADYALVVTPYYNKPTARGQIEHYTKVAEKSPIPVILYNVPSRTGTDMQPSTIARLSEHPNIVAVKEASGCAAKGADVITAVSKDFYLYSGDDKLNFPLVALGAKGAVSVVSNVVPGLAHQALQQALACDSAARDSHYKLLPLAHGLFIETNPAPAKKALQLKGIIKSDELRLPLVPVTPDTEIQLKAILRGLED